MKTAIYIRVSTSRQEASPEDQRRACVKLIASRGWELAGEYRDLGITGTRGGDVRPGFAKLVADAVAGRFDAIVTWDRARLSRQDAYEYAAAVLPLRNAGIHVESVVDGVEQWDSMSGRVVGLVGQESKHEYAVAVARDSTRTITTKAERLEGIPGFARPYGYRRVVAVEGRRHRSTLEVIPEEAAVVRRVFDFYCTPKGSLSQAVMMLNREGIKPTRGKAWCHGAIYRMLRNPIYHGTVVWGRMSRGAHYTRGADGPVPRTNARRNPEGRVAATTNAVPPIVHDNAVPVIIARDQFDKVQRLLAERGSRKTSPPKIRPLSGLVKCGSCGGTMRFDGNHVRCNHDRLGQYDRCTWRSFKAEPIVEQVFSWLRDQVASPKYMKLLRAALKRQAAALVASTGDAGDRRRAIDRRLKDIAAEVDRGVRRLTLLDDDAAAAALGKHLNALARDRAALERERDAMPTTGSAARDAERLVAVAVAKAEALRDTLAAAEPVAVNSLLRDLGVRLTIKSTKGQRGPVVIEASAPIETAAAIFPMTPVSRTRGCRAR
jgi:site-specific DNA recombinase